ncbi:TPA: hypothetical protein SL531_001307 [Pseudomonas aeruginosa]|nr:hypothetical protein [Pseudomonas aeruginosa]
MAFERARLLRNTHFADGRLKAQEGATGDIVGDDCGMLTIHFDDSEHFVELDGSGLRIAHNIPRLAVERIPAERVQTEIPDERARTVMDDYGPSDLDIANNAVAARDGNGFYLTMGRRFRVLATFPDDPEGERAANAYMQEHDGASVLAVVGGRVILADKNDKGIPIARERSAA